MVEQIMVDNIMFLDIETVPQTDDFSTLSNALQHCWEDKYEKLRNRQPGRFGEDMTPGEVFEQEGGIYAEFGKIVCVSVGFVRFQGDEKFFRVKSYYGDDEKELLEDLANMLDHWGKNKEHTLCGHNAREFDFPYIGRRMLINGVALPEILKVNGKKPWELSLLDTMDMWKFGDYKHYTSLNLLTTIFGIPTPKDDIDGSQVAHVYYVEKDVDRIARYCEKDVLATTQLYLRMTGQEMIPEGRMERVD